MAVDRLVAGLYPLGLWTDPCEVRCACGYHAVLETCERAQRDAWRHDATHGDASEKPVKQLSLFVEDSAR
jgi:hypothetical protein